MPLHNVEMAIKTIEQDGGVILTDFSSIADVEKVNSDAEPFIAAIKAEVSSQAQRHKVEPCMASSSAGHTCGQRHVMLFL